MAIEDRVRRLERRLQTNATAPGARCMTCRREHFEAAGLFSDLVDYLRDPDAVLAPEPVCRCACCADAMASVAAALVAVDAKALAAPVDVAALRKRLDPYMGPIGERVREYLANEPRAQQEGSLEPVGGWQE